MSNPSISVIVPVYKVEQYIKLCVDSILAQTFQDFEIILVDDATPDNSFALCQELYSGNDKVKFVRHEKNLGLGAARNTGMKHARGKYIYFVDSDDFILPETLEKFFNAAEKNNAQVVHAAGWFELYQDEPEAIREENLRLIWDNYSQEGFLNPNIIYRLTEHWATGNIGTMAWLCFCRRDFLEEKHIEFLPIISEDEPFNFALFCLAERYYIMHEAFYLYRRRSGSIMSTKNAEQFSKSIQSIVRGAAYIKNFLDHVPRFKGYEQWHKTIMDEFFRRFIYNHTAPYYSALTVPPEINSAAEDTLKKFFGDGTPFVKNFFDGYHLFRRQSEILLQRNNALSAQMMSIFNRMELSAKKIVFVNFLGRGYGCNPKYIAEEILRQNLPYDMVWLVNDLNESMPEKIRKVSYGSLDSIYELATAKVIVSNVKNLLPYPNKKRGQFFIMTWHAWQGLKYIEKDAEEKLSPTYVAQSRANSKITDLMMVGTQDALEEYRRVMWYDGEILPCGLPRNDIFFRRDEKLIAQVKQLLGVPPENKIVMYAPTFRDDVAVTAEVCRLDAKKLLAALKKRFGGEWSLLMRQHPNVAAAFAKNYFDVNVINATTYPDMQELILISDVLISDYSSVICDFMFTGKPVFIYAKDYDSYTNERGLRPIFFDLPYHVNKSEAELFYDIETFDAAALEPQIKRFLDMVKPFDDGHASERVVERIKLVITNSYAPPRKY